MARAASDTCLTMRVVREAGVVRHAVDALPEDRFLLDPCQADLLDFGLALADGDVTAHALLDIWQAGGHAGGGCAVAKGTVEAGVLRVDAMIERNRLHGRSWRLGGLQAGRDHPDQKDTACQHGR